HFADVPANPVRLGTLVLWAEVATRLGARSAAADLLEALGPWRDQVVLDALGTLGSVSRPLGMLAAELGRAEESDAHFAPALVVDDRRAHVVVLGRIERDAGFEAAPHDGLEREPVDLRGRVALVLRVHGHDQPGRRRGHLREVELEQQPRSATARPDPRGVGR